MHNYMYNNTNLSYNLDSSMPFYIQFLTYKLDNFKKDNKSGISKTAVEDLLGDEINELLTDKNKIYILSTWKYGKVFKLNEEAHANGNILFGKNMSWIQSFIVGLLMLAFH